MSSKSTKLDPRVIRTRNLLRQALLDLVPQRGFEDLTIQDITDQATLNRATFYLHYTDKNELLLDTFEHIVSGEIPPPPPDGVDFASLPQSPIISVFNHVGKYAGFYCVMLGEKGVPAFMARVRTFIEETILNWLAAVLPEKFGQGMSSDIVVNYLGAGYLGVISWWLDNEMPYTPEEMEAQLFALTQNGLLGIAKHIQ